MKHTLIAAIAATLIACGCSAGHADPDTAAETQGRTQALTEGTAALLEELDFSGTLLVSRDGDILLREAVTPPSLDTTAPVTPATRFPIASMTKSFTAALVLKLVDEGKLSLDQTLADLLPDFDVPYAGDVTLRQLLQNRSGIPHYVDIPGWFDNDVKRVFTEDSFLSTLAQLELKFPPGSDYLYSNVNYYLLAKVIDRYSGMDYETWLQTQILDPLGMTATGQLYGGADDLAVNYLKSDDGSYEVIPVVNPVLFRGTASMVSTVDDLRAWGEAIINGEIYSETAAAEAFNADTPMAWNVAELPAGDGQTTGVIFYNGRLIGYLSLILLLPEEDGVIVVLNNNTVGYENMLGLATELAAEYFGDAD